MMMGEETGPSALWAEVIMWAGERHGGALNTLPGLWKDNAGKMDGVSIDVAVNAHKEEIDGIPPFGVRLTSPTHLMACIFTPAGGVISPAGPGDEDRLIDFFKQARGLLQ